MNKRWSRWPPELRSRGIRPKVSDVKTLIIFCPLLVLLASCSLFKKEEEEKPKPRSTVVVGEITNVHPKEGFVLFRRYGPGDLLSGGLLSSRSLNGKRAASLTLSPEKLGRYYTADYSKEADPPREGDVVVLTKQSDDTQNDIFGPLKTETEELEVKKRDSSPEPEILENAASQRSG